MNVTKINDLDCCVILSPDFDLNYIDHLRLRWLEITLQKCVLGPAVWKVLYLWEWIYAESIGLEFRRMLIYFLRCKRQRLSHSQIFFFVFSTLTIFFSTFFPYQTYISTYYLLLPKTPRKCKAFIARKRVSLNHFWTDFSIINRWQYHCNRRQYHFNCWQYLFPRIPEKTK